MKHYDDNEFAEVVMNGPGKHEAECTECAAETEGVREVLDEFHTEHLAGGDKPGAFWTRQHAQIESRITRRNHFGRAAWAMASTAAVFALAAVMLVPPHVPSAPKAAPVTTASVSDEALLQDIQQQTTSTVPDAMAPANVLADEVDRGLRFAAENQGEHQ